MDFNELHSDVTAAPSWLAARPSKGLAVGLHLMRHTEIPLQLDFAEETLTVLPANTSLCFLVHCSCYTWRAWATLFYRSGGQQWLTLASLILIFISRAPVTLAPCHSLSKLKQCCSFPSAWRTTSSFPTIYGSSLRSFAGSGRRLTGAKGVNVMRLELSAES